MQTSDTSGCIARAEAPARCPAAQELTFPDGRRLPAIWATLLLSLDARPAQQPPGILMDRRGGAASRQSASTLACGLLPFRAMAIARLLVEHKQEILTRWRLRVGKKLAGGAVDRAALEDGWSHFLDELARHCAPARARRRCRCPTARRTARSGCGSASTPARSCARPESCTRRSSRSPTSTAAPSTPASSAAWCAASTPCSRPPSASTGGGATPKSSARPSTSSAASPATTTAARAAARCASCTRGPRVAARGRRRRRGSERFSLASVLADAVADVRDAAGERGVPVLVDLGDADRGARRARSVAPRDRARAAQRRRCDAPGRQRHRARADALGRTRTHRHSGRMRRRRRRARGALHPPRVGARAAAAGGRLVDRARRHRRQSWNGACAQAAGRRLPRDD